MRLFSENLEGGVLDLNDKFEDAATNQCTVRDNLNEKHPPGKPADLSYMIQDNRHPTNYICFKSFKTETVLKSSQNTKGSTGLSGMHSNGWRDSDSAAHLNLNGKYYAML